MTNHESRNSFSVLGVRVDAVQIPDVIKQMVIWLNDTKDGHYIAVTGMHQVIEAQTDSFVLDALNGADLVVPDGMPLVWLGRRAKLSLDRRVYGPELMETFCSETRDAYSHFFYGGEDGVADQLAGILKDRYGIRVAGTRCPPFRRLTEAEDAREVALINESAPDIVWVGLGAPKQELWMETHKEVLDARVAVGVGAAFDFVTGRKAEAPEWLKEHGLQWAHRLAHEPRRLWRRYLVGGSKFGAYLLRDELGKLRKSVDKKRA